MTGPKRRRGCMVEGCGSDAISKGYCQLHYARHKRGIPMGGVPWAAERLCSIDGCGGVMLAKGLCGLHYNRIRAGVPVLAPEGRFGKVKTNVGACIKDGCDRQQYCRHLCRNHYSTDLRRRKRNESPPSGDRSR